MPTTTKEWPKGQTSLLKKVVRQIPATLEKQERWSQISRGLNKLQASDVLNDGTDGGSGEWRWVERSKRECFDRYKELKDERSRVKEDAARDLIGKGKENDTSTYNVIEDEKDDTADAEADALREQKNDKADAEAEALRKEEDDKANAEAEALRKEDVRADAEAEALRKEEEAKAKAISDEAAQLKLSEQLQSEKADRQMKEDEEDRIMKEEWEESERLRKIAEEPTPEDKAPESTETETEPETEVTAEDIEPLTPSTTEPTTTPLSPPTTQTLRNLILGASNKIFPPSWSQQGFFYQKNEDLTYGLTQTDGGPCGVIACVNAEILKNMLYPSPEDKESKSVEEWCEKRNLKKKEQKALLTKSLADMIWRCSSSGASPRPAKACIPSDSVNIQRSSTFKYDGITEKTEIVTCHTYASLHSTLKENISHYTKTDGGGTVLLLYSILLSRSLTLVKKDMDVNFDVTPTLIGNHGYASQEMVNLMITGIASTNLFNGNHKFEDEVQGSGDSIVMKGVEKQSDIGLLTLFEAYGSLEVGSFLKEPVFPIWVVCSESHYSVLFSLNPKHTKAPVEMEDERKFDIYYYDQLNEQEAECRFTLDKDAENVPNDGEGEETDLVPPLDKVLRTKWKGCGVDWNGTDPIL